MNRVPSTKSGTERAASEKNRVATSRTELRRRAETMPAGTPTTMDISVARSVSSSVTQQRRTISVETGVCMRRDSPKSPWIALRSHRPYWTRIGSSRPYFFSSAATTSGEREAFAPTRAWANPPGTSRIATKTIVATPKVVIAARMKRLTTYRSMRRSRFWLVDQPVRVICSIRCHSGRPKPSPCANVTLPIRSLR